jgi:glycosyltransferase involved in cell wall biosynthesis
MTAIYPRATDTFIQREVAALRRLGVDVRTISIRTPPESENVGPEQLAERATTTFILPARLWTLVSAHFGMLARSPLRYLKALRTALFVRGPGVRSLLWQVFYFAEAAVVAMHVRRLGIAHLHNHFSDSSCYAAMLAAEMGGFSFSLAVHGPNEFFDARSWRLDEKLRRARFAACISHFARSQAMLFAPPEDWHRLHVVHCGVEPGLFAPKRYHDGAGARLTCVGRLARAKGLPILFDALVLLARTRPDIHLTLAGDGPDRAALEALAKQLGLSSRVTFLGYRSQAGVRELLAETDVFVLASLAEGVPVVLMEAMAAGVPVVATRVAGIPELIDDGVSGLLVPPGDAQALAGAIERLLNDSALRESFARRGREKVERDFNVDREAERLRLLLAGTSLPAAAPAGPRASAPASP